ncbi:hypothetical protein NDU88_006365 [Pleurodeles waltl]|uniref:Uncharacterized protein n=1 Tax=Pleurodeles waltl TaxID=8319 RepID=A0AAV7SPF5_PLEWA|nr:hypothetical protein NDU88_006365 [Pleurodeles waltl]
MRASGPCRTAGGREWLRRGVTAACWEKGVLRRAGSAVGLDCGPRGSRRLLPQAPEAGLGAVRLSMRCGPVGPVLQGSLGLSALWMRRLVGGCGGRSCLLELLTGGGGSPGGADRQSGRTAAPP